MPSNPIYPRRGFTLVELMIVIAIVAILAAIAYPAYTQFVKRSTRADAKALLLENAQFLERNLTMSNSYAVDSSGATITASALPASQAPRDATEATAKYTITLTELSASKFKLNAVPAGSHTGDECGTLSINEQGRKTATGGTLTAAECWSR